MSASKPTGWGVEHSWPWYGECLHGTELQLKRLGIAPCDTYPLEYGSILHCTDPRGLPCEILAPIGKPDLHIVRIKYPGRVSPSLGRRLAYAAGVVLEERCCGDRYVGTGDALIQAGLARPDQLPGPNAVRKHTIDISPEGRPWNGARYAKAPDLFHGPGGKTITRKGKTKFEVLVYVSHEERERRSEVLKHTERQLELDRPYPSLFEIAERRPRLAIVKSARSFDGTPMSAHHHSQRHLSLVHSISRSQS